MLQQLRERLALQAQRHTVRVWPAHGHAVTVFRLAGTQWRVVPVPTARGVRLMHVGLDYSSLRLPLQAAERLVPEPLRKPLDVLLLQLQTLEVVAAEARNS